MADIRQVGNIHPFAGQGTEDSTQAYPLGPAAPWFTSPGSIPVDVSEDGLGGTDFPPASSLGYYSALAAGGDGVETWGHMDGSPGEVAGWRFGLYTVASIPSGGVDGYQCLPHNNIGGTTITLRRYAGGEFTNVVTEVGMGGGYALMRRNGSFVEVWQTMTHQTESWTLRIQVADTTYVDGPFYAVYGTTGTETGWTDEMGFGIRNRQHIYRWLGRASLVIPVGTPETP